MLNGWAERLETATGRFAGILNRRKYAVLVLFSLAYFLTTCYRASRKLFWFDELLTMHVSHQPDLASVWRALMQGADLNPPILYGLTRFSELLFGAGQIGSRLPAIVGFWIFCLCLFRFVSVRTSALSGFVSMSFPLVTTASYYA